MKSRCGSKYRHEYKYIISDKEIGVLKQRLSHVMTIDPFAKTGSYKVMSLYFDDYNDQYLYENINGNDPREKVRIRIYNGEQHPMFLERKQKQNGMTLKQSTTISLDHYKMLVNKGIAGTLTGDLFIDKIAVEEKTRLLKPKIIVIYDRIPYVYGPGNVRITIDTNLTSSNDINNFLSGKIMGRPVMPAGMSLLEVKWDEFLPDHLKQLCSVGNMTQMAYSKYMLCRKYHM